MGLQGPTGVPGSTLRFLLFSLESVSVLLPSCLVASCKVAAPLLLPRWFPGATSPSWAGSHLVLTILAARDSSSTFKVNSDGFLQEYQMLELGFNCRFFGVQVPCVLDL